MAYCYWLYYNGFNRNGVKLMVDFKTDLQRLVNKINANRPNKDVCELSIYTDVNKNEYNQLLVNGQISYLFALEVKYDEHVKVRAYLEGILAGMEI